MRDLNRWSGDYYIQMVKDTCGSSNKYKKVIKPPEQSQEQGADPHERRAAARLEESTRSKPWDLGKDGSDQDQDDSSHSDDNWN